MPLAHGSLALQLLALGRSPRRADCPLPPVSEHLPNPLRLAETRLHWHESVVELLVQVPELIRPWQWTQSSGA